MCNDFCSIVFVLVSVVCISLFFTASFYYFLFERYLNSSMTGFLSDILLPFLNSNDLMKSHAQPLITACSIWMFQKFDWLKQPPDSLKTSVTKKISQELGNRHIAIVLIGRSSIALTSSTCWCTGSIQKRYLNNLMIIYTLKF